MTSWSCHIMTSWWRLHADISGQQTCLIRGLWYIEKNERKLRIFHPTRSSFGRFIWWKCADEKNERENEIRLAILYTFCSGKISSPPAFYREYGKRRKYSFRTTRSWLWRGTDEISGKFDGSIYFPEWYETNNHNTSEKFWFSDFCVKQMMLSFNFGVVPKCIDAHILFCCGCAAIVFVHADLLYINTSLPAK